VGGDGRDGAERLAATFRGDADMLRVVDAAPGRPPAGPKGDED